jgi:hypothetical protein
MEQVPRYSSPAPHVLSTTVGQTDLSSFSTPDLRDLSSLASALQARAEQEINARKPPFPSSLPPQLVISWLPLRDVSSALCVSSTWHSTSEAVFQIVAQTRSFVREPANTPWRDVVRFSIKQVIVLTPGQTYTTHDELARALGVYDQGWVSGFADDFTREDEPQVDETGDFISEVESPVHAVAFRANRNDRIYILGRRGVVVGYLGEFSSAMPTPAQVERFSVSELKSQLAGRGLSTAGPKATLKQRLLEALREVAEDNAEYLSGY